MLILARKSGEGILIGGQIVVRVISVDGTTVRLGVEAPRELPVYREEIYRAICRENLGALASAQGLGLLPPPIRGEPRPEE